MVKSVSARRALLALTVAVALVASVGPAAAQEDPMPTGAAAGYGIGSAFCTLLYAPVKLIYAGGGALVSGAAWLFSGGNSSVMGPILNASVRGDYVVTPDHLRGRDNLEFVGRSPDYRRIAADSPITSEPVEEHSDF